MTKRTPQSTLDNRKSPLVPPPELIIRPTTGWQLVNWRELVQYRDLLYFLTIRGIKAKYAQSVLGIGWAIIQPLFSTLIFTVVFGNLARVSSDGRGASRKS